MTSLTSSRMLCTFLAAHLAAQSFAASPVEPRVTAPAPIGADYDPATFEPLRVLGFGNVLAAEFSPDGQWIAVSGNSVLLLLDAGTYEVVKQFFGHTALIYGLKWSPDGRFIATGADDYLVKIWDVESGELVRTFVHFRRVNSVDWSPDGRRLVSAGDFMTAVWEVETGDLVAFLSNAIMTTVAWSPDGQYVAAGDALDRKVRIWETKGWGLLRELTGHSSRVTTVAWSPDSQFLATGAEWPDRFVRIWQAGTWELVRTVEHYDGGVQGVAWDRSGRFLATAGGTVRIWDSDGTLVDTLGDHLVTVPASIAWDAEGKRLVSASFARSVYIWRLGIGGLPLTLRGHTGQVSSVSWNPDGRYLATSGYSGGLFPSDHTVKIWEAATGRLLRTFTGDSAGMRTVAWSPDGKVLAVADSMVRLWDAETGEELNNFSGGGFLTWRSDGRYLAGTGYPTLPVWDVKTGKRVREFFGQIPAWSPDGNSIAAASRDGGFDGHLRVYDFETGELVWTVQHPSIRVVAWSPDGRSLASTGQDDALRNSDLRIWDAATGKLIRSILVSNSALWAVTWSPDSRYVAVGADNPSRAITIWDIQKGTLLNTLLGHTSNINSVQWNPLACYLASGGQDAAPRLWGCPNQ